MSEKSEELTIIHEGEKFNCQVIKKDDKTFVAKCEMDEEECPGCAEAVAVGWALNYIKPLDEGKADELFHQVVNNKISADRAIDECVAVASKNGDKELVETLKHLKTIMHKPLAELKEEQKKID